MILVITTLIFIVVLSFLFLTHELGHFIFAKKTGISVVEFGLGFPPRLFKWKKGETTYSINLIPFGAFVRLLGLEDPKNKDKKSYWRQSVGKRFLTASGGILGNFFFAWLVLTISLLILNFVPVKEFVIVQDVEKNSPAYQAGIKQGDLLISANGVFFKNSLEVSQFTKSHKGEKIKITIKRFGKEKTKEVQLRNAEYPLGVAMIDASLGKQNVLWKTPIDALVMLGDAIYLTTEYLIRSIVSVFMGPRVPLQLGGPVAVWGVVSQFYSIGFIYLLRLVAFLSLGLAFFNFLPLPALDGSRLVFLVLEKIFGKKIIKPNAENTIHNVGFVLLIFLSIIITYNDIMNLIRR